MRLWSSVSEVGLMDRLASILGAHAQLFLDDWKLMIVSGGSSLKKERERRRYRVSELHIWKGWSLPGEESQLTSKEVRDKLDLPIHWSNLGRYAKTLKRPKRSAPNKFFDKSRKLPEETRPRLVSAKLFAWALERHYFHWRSWNR